MNTGLGLKMLMLTNGLSFSDGGATNFLLAVGQMSLCFAEVIVFAALAIISSFIGEKVFIIIFILSILSSIFININIKNDKYVEKACFK